MSVERLLQILKGALYRLARASVTRGLHPAWLGYHCILTETVSDYFSRYGQNGSAPAGRCETVHPESVASHPLPCNVDDRDDLPADRGWWGFSFQDVPSRVNDPTRIIHIPSGRIIPYIDPEKNQFWPAVLNQDAWALELREMSFERFHRKVFRSRRPVRRARATWMLERVYRNYSHWLTAHLPKILLLRSRDQLAHLMLPPASMRTDVIDDSLRLLGVDPEDCDTFDPSRPMEVGQLTIVDTDRFRPELLRSVREALCTFDSRPRTRKVFISRAKASRRHVTNRKALWRLLQQAGFECVIMEELSFEEQIAYMQDVSVLVAPHGAGLANMMFCAPGTHVVEIADSGFPNPNFYTLASAMKLPYWLIQAQGVGSEHPSVRDMHVPLRTVEETLRHVPL